MIGDRTARRKCKPGMLHLVENYEAALADTTQVWDVHHRLETVPGFDAAALKRKHLYWGVNPEALIFVTRAMHLQIHGAPMQGKHHGEETLRRLAEANLGKTHTEETKRKMSEAQRLRWQRRKECQSSNL